MNASGGLSTRWMTDLFNNIIKEFNNIIKEGCIPDDWRKSILEPVYKGKGDPLVYGSYRAITKTNTKQRRRSCTMIL